MSGSATSMICYRYAFKVSPILKNICSYLYDVEGTMVDVIVEDIYSDEKFESLGVKIVNTGDKSDYKFYLRLLLLMDKKSRFLHEVRSRINQYSRVFAVDFQSLDILHTAGYDLSKVIFLSLEGTDYLQHFDKSYAAEILARCALCIVQSRERADDINDYLSCSVEFEYLPVSCRFQTLDRSPGHGRLQLIYSGYFAEWACLSEFLAAYQESRSYEISSLLLQGHSIGTDEYLSRIKSEAAGIPATVVDTSYYSDVAHAGVLGQYDVGLAFYKNIHATANFENLILSSGKIATYLWNGLAVLTNIRSKYSNMPPFVFVDLSDPSGLSRAVERIDADRDLFMNAAHELADRVYNFDVHMAAIHVRMQSLFSQKFVQ
jgi:hypothetical protein